MATHMQSKIVRLFAFAVIGALLINPELAMSRHESSWTDESNLTANIAPAREDGITAMVLSPVPIGPVYPPPLGVTYLAAPVDGSFIAKTGGRNIIFTQTNADRYTTLFWGPSDASAIKHSLVGGSLGPSNVLTLSNPLSNLSGGIGVWSGSSSDPFGGPTLTTRFSLATTNSGGPLPMISAASVGIVNASAVVTVTGNFTANLFFGVGLSGSYLGSNNYFDAGCPDNLSCPANTQPVLSSFNGAFWYTAPDVNLSMSGSMCAGQTGIYIITATNNGPGPVTSLVVTDVVPSGQTFNTYLATQGGYNSGTGVWTVGSLSEGQSQTLTLITNVPGPGLYTNTASASQYQFDPNPANNSTFLSSTASRCVFIPSTRKSASSDW